MPADLTLPGTIPNLLRRGSPVVIPTGPGPVVGPMEPRGFIGCPPVDGAVVARGEFGVVEWLALDDIALDLTDATGRAHAAWWLAERTGDPDPRMTPSWCYSEAGWCAWQVCGLRRITTGAGYWSVGRTPVDDIDPNDRRLLPDGSRWVDAEALRLVCLHVVGVPDVR